MENLKNWKQFEKNTDKHWFNDRDEWDKERNKMDVSDDDVNWSRDDKGELIAFWIEDREEGWIKKYILTKDDFYSILNDIEDLYEWDYIEHEGKFSVRFDWNRGNQSLWLHNDGSVSGTIPPKIKNQIKKIKKLW